MLAHMEGTPVNDQSLAEKDRKLWLGETHVHDGSLAHSKKENLQVWSSYA